LRGNARPEPVLRTNPSTRPFYNERGVHVALTLAALVVAALTIFNLTQIGLLYAKQSQLSRRAQADQARAQELRAHAAQTRQMLNTKELSHTSIAAREANTIIRQRLFSWTDLLNGLVKTLPDDVRITALRPRVERDGGIVVQMAVTARSVEDIDLFISNLEATPAFSEVYAPEDETSNEGLVQATVEGKYAIAR
jgi:Tfp pilus assembly protein PilN